MEDEALFSSTSNMRNNRGGRSRGGGSYKGGRRGGGNRGRFGNSNHPYQRDQRICFNCQQSGHVAVNCPNIQ